jgi:GDP-4-dehydro-6-deoxy-D-mannose reductase
VRVLVTGAGGFVGRLLVAELRRSGHEPIPLYSPRTAGPDGLDLLDAEGIRHWIDEARPEVVVHLAARAKPAAIEALRSLLEENLSTTTNVLEAVRLTAPGARVVLASSSAVYGAIPRERNPVVEEEPLSPSLPYGAAKAAAEAVASVYGARGMNVIVVRSFNLIGPGQDASFAIASFGRQIALIKARRMEPVIHTGPLDRFRDFTDVRDAVRAYVLLTERAPEGGRYNLCSGVARSMRDVLGDLLDLAEVKAVIHEDPAKGSGGPLDVHYQCGSRAAIERSTGWTPTISWEQTLRDVNADWDQRTNGEAKP